jgi:hypothetical protein
MTSSSDLTQAEDGRSRTVSLGDLLSMSTGILLTPFSQMHAAVETLAGGPVWTHQLPDAIDALRPALLAQFPWLADITAPEGLDSREAVDAYLAPLIEIHGDQHALTAAETGWRRDPIADLVVEAVPERVIVVATQDGAR